MSTVPKRAAAPSDAEPKQKQKLVALSPSMSATSTSLKQLFDTQQKYLNYFFDNLEYAPLEEFCQAVLTCSGVVVFSGVGKSGFIAQKISMTLVSTGTKSVFLNPTDSLHGDIGIVGPKDILVLFSKSGSTEELLKLIPFAKAKGAKLIGVSSVKGSKLDQACDSHVWLPLERELCPFDLAPVTSTAIQMLFGDTCAVAIMKARNLTQEQYAMNHPAGRIGKRLMLRVSDVMKALSELPTCTPGEKLVDTISTLSSKGCGCVLVCDAGGVLLGTFTDGDLRRALAGFGASVLEDTMGNLMTKSPRITTAATKALDAMQAMESPKPVTFLPVLANDSDRTLVGLVTLHGLVAAGL